MRRITCALMILTAVVLAGCGGGGGTRIPTDNPVSGIQVGIVPHSLVLRTGETCLLSASVTGAANSAVTWSVIEEIDGGLVTADGHYTAPSSEVTCHVKATSVQDPSKYCLVIIIVNGTGTLPPGQTGVNVQISPREVTLPPNESVQFTATVTGHSNTAVTWEVEEAGGGIITSDGVYTTPNHEITAHVTATSVAVPSKSDTAIIYVITNLPPIPMPPPPPP